MKRKNVIRYIVLPGLLLICAAALYIYKEFTRTHKDTAILRPDYSFTATSLLNEFENNEQSSNSKYWDKVLRVEGTIKELDRDDKGYYSVILGDTSSMSSVRCSMDSNHNAEAGKLTKGSTIAIKGICTGFNTDELLGSDVILVRSVIDNKN